ncbi:transposase [Candidatus Roizmanbacteria bacterium]|nr:transposase [Candidatus Roizmanbacteria bacterium]
MKTKRFTTEQIIGILKEADGEMLVKKLCRKYGMSEATLYYRKTIYSGMADSDACRLTIMENDNRHLKKLIGDQAIVIAMFKLNN